jgi:acylphosphatase
VNLNFAGAQINVRGLVQGVGYRYWCYRKAHEYGIIGYVSNLYDGSVEVMAEGDRSIIEEFIKNLKIGPSNASVSDIKIIWYDKPRGFSNFAIEYKD